jgi:undecaprenyl-diphosphatase
MRLKFVVAMGLVLSMIYQMPVRAEEAEITSTEVSPIKKFFQDGAYIVTSPLRLHKEDLPMVLGVTALLGGAFALDKTTHNNLFPFVTSGSANTLRRYGDIAQYSGPIFGALFAVQGWAADNPESKKTAALAFESFLWAGAIELSAKSIVGRNRPTVSTNPFTFRPGQSDGSFPSGHTTEAFSAATVFAEQYPRWEVVVPVYAAASAVAFSRLYANQHWGSDVVAGALLGIGVSHLLRKLYDHPKNNWKVLVDGQSIKLARSFGGSDGEGSR